MSHLGFLVCMLARPQTRQLSSFWKSGGFCCTVLLWYVRPTSSRAVSSGSDARCWMASLGPVMHVKARSWGANMTPRPRTSRTTA
jgi:hypothetical protein